MKYKLIQRPNPLDRTKLKWYAVPVNDGKIDKKALAKEIVDLSALSRGDVSDVIENLIDVVPKYLMMGKSVNMGELGTVRVSFSSKGVEDPSKFSTHLITGPRIVFTPSVELKDALSRMHFELAKGEVSTGEGEDEKEDEPQGPVEE